MVVMKSDESVDDGATEGEGVLLRRTANYEFKGKHKLMVKTYQHNLQYVHLYTTRLNILKPRVLRAMQEKIGDNLLDSSTVSVSSNKSSPRKDVGGGAAAAASPSKLSMGGSGSGTGGQAVTLVSISAIRPDQRRYAVVGTLQKRQHLKPSILKEVSEEHNLEPVLPRDNFVDEQCDQMFIEDNTQSLALTGNIKTHYLCNGMVIGAIGRENSEGEFHVDQVFYPQWAEQDLSAVDLSPKEEDSYLMFVSGLNIGADYEPVTLDMLAAFVSGDCGPSQSIAKNIVRVIVCGNSLSSNCVDKSLHSQARYLSKKSTVGSVLPLQTLDSLLQQMAASCDLDLMPGENDPCTAFLPQQPLHRCMFPKSRMFSSFNTVTNPYHFSVDTSEVVGCSGQNLKDIARYSKVSDELAALEMTLNCQVTCPTAPDTLPCYPLGKNRDDPFVIERQPRVYFAGNCSSLQYKHTCEGNQLLLCVPSFSETKQIVLVNLKDLKVTPVCFGVSLI